MKVELVTSSRQGEWTVEYSTNATSNIVTIIC